MILSDRGGPSIPPPTRISELKDDYWIGCNDLGPMIITVGIALDPLDPGSGEGL